MAKKKGYDTVGQITAYEDGLLTDEGIFELFQHLLDTGKIYHLQGSYQRTMSALLEAGYVVKK